ncbi:MAG TPA: DNRLRE domain-containing protein, partial [Acidimicrobiales bacterium]
MAQAAPPAEVFVSRSLAVVADTYVSEVQPSQTAGSAPRLIVDGSPRRVTYLRFAVPPFQGLLRSATLRLHVADAAGAGSDHGGTVIGSSDSSWPEATTTWATRPPLDGPVAGGLGRAPRGQWIEQTVTGLVQTGEPLTLGIRSMSSDDVAYDAQGGGRGPRLVLEMDAPPNGTIISAVGDMVCGPRPSTTPTTCHQQQVSDMLVADPDLEAFLALGDLQYNTGALVDFQTFYEPSYGRVKDITHPVVGNHKYQTADAAGYWDYFGAAAGVEEEGWYSLDVGTSWHLVALNSNCSEVSCLNGSPQLQWLRADLQANDRPCVLAYWHHPRWSSGKAPGNNPSVDA